MGKSAGDANPIGPDRADLLRMQAGVLQEPAPDFSFVYWQSIIFGAFVILPVILGFWLLTARPAPQVTAKAWPVCEASHVETRTGGDCMFQPGIGFDGTPSIGGSPFKYCNVTVCDKWKKQ